MTNISSYFEQAELALAAYSGLTKDMKGVPYTTALKDDDKGMTEAQAARFASTWRVVDQYNDPLTGLSATVFEKTVIIDNVEVKQYSLAIRGTDGVMDLLSNSFIVNGIPPEISPQYLSLKAQVQTWLADPQKLQGKNFTVTGHSLGGYLAAGLLADFPASISHAYLYNAPGNTSELSLIAQALGFTNMPDPAKISNLRADSGIGLSPIASLGYNFSPPISIAIEDQLSLEFIPELTLNHSLRVLTDALALHAVYAQLDPNARIEDIAGIVKTSSNLEGNTLEIGLDNLRELFLGATVSATVPGDREGYYKNLYYLTDWLVERNKDGAPLKLDALAYDGGANALKALSTTPDGLAYRYALTELKPFAVTGDASLYASYNAAGELTNLTEQYLNDRAQMLQWKMLIDLLGEDYSERIDLQWIQSGDYIYQDVASGLTLDIDGFNPTTFASHFIKFGDTENNSLVGGVLEDRLFGGGGGDTLHGGDGGDVIEGNAGDDYLYGNEGSDYLYGQQGNDFLTGGTGNDVLDGGENDDRYYYNIGDGNDIINDATGSNTLVINGQTIGALTRTSVDSKTYKDVHDNTYALTDAGVLLITVLDDLDQHRSGTLTLNKFNQASNNFGLVLNDPLDLDEPNSGSSIYGVGNGEIINPEGELDSLHVTQTGRDQSYQFYVNTMSIQFDAALATKLWTYDGMATNGYTFQGGYQNDRLIGGQYRDWLDGKNGDDYINAGRGVYVNNSLLGGNFVRGGLGSDYLLGGADTDFISGNDYDKWELWDRANPLLTAGYLDESAESKDYINGGGGNDRLSGDEGDDEVLGGTGHDDLLGGAGKDILAGGSGNDYIMGDSRIELYYANGSYVAGKDWIYSKDNLIDYNDILDGGLNADYLLGEIGDDLVLGGEGNDYIWGDRSETHEEISFIDGNSSIAIAAYTELTADLHGNDTLLGEAGTDFIFGNGGDDLVDGGLGADVLRGDDDKLAGQYHGKDTLIGGDDTSDDILIGGGNDDYLEGGGGNDFLVGDATRNQGETTISLGGQYHGNDLLNGGAGNDTLEGGGKDDILRGGDGDDQLWGDSQYDDDGIKHTTPWLDEIYHGNDTLYGEAGNDFIHAGAGDDTVLGGEGADTLHGGAGNDTLLGGSGADSIHGDAGDDILDGGSGANFLGGGDGNDTYRIYADQHTTIEDTEGSSTIGIIGDVDVSKMRIAVGAQFTQIFFTSDGKGILNLDNATFAALTSLTFENNTTVAVSDIQPFIKQSIGLNTVGSFDIDQAAGAEVIIQVDGGDDGSDEVTDISFEAYEDQDLKMTVRFSSGVSSSFFVSNYFSASNASYGTSSGSSSGSSSGTSDFSPHMIVGYKTGSGFQGSTSGGVTGFKIINSAIIRAAVTTDIGFDDAIFGTPNADILFGAAGKDYINGGMGDDNLNGGEGDNTLYGGGGNDTLFGGSGADSIHGDAGDDMLNGGSGANFLSGGAGNDTYRIYADQHTTIEDTQGSSTIGIIGDVDVSKMRIAVGAQFTQIFFTSDGTGILNMDNATFAALTSLTFENNTTVAVSDIQPFIKQSIGLNTVGSFDINEAAGAEVIIQVDDGSDEVADISFEPYEDQDLKMTVRFYSGHRSTYYVRNYFSSSNTNSETSLSSPNMIVGYKTGGGFQGSTSGGVTGFRIINSSIIRTAVTTDSGYDDAIFGTPNADILFGAAGKDYINGGMGDDNLYGGDGADNLIGGQGFDFLSGGLGNDTYLFGRGDGPDWIRDVQPKGVADQINTLRFKAGVLPSDVWLLSGLRGLDNLTIVIHDTSNNATDSVEVEYFTYNDDPMHWATLHQIKFDDGTTWDLVDILAKIHGGTEKDNIIRGTVLADTISGGLGNDQIHGLAGNDTLLGGADDDKLYGNEGNDTLDGGLGNDTISGGLGNDTYLFGKGDGQDIISYILNEQGSSDSYDTTVGKIDTLQFRSDVLPSEVLVTRYYSDLYVSIAGTTDRIQVERFFYDSDPANSYNPLQQIKFADGSWWDIATIKTKANMSDDTAQKLWGTNGDDTINALGGNDTVYGGTGNDTLIGGIGDDEVYGEDGDDILYGNDGNDWLIGGTGDDALEGGRGNDTLLGDANSSTYMGANDIYLFGAGDGQDTIYEEGGHADVLLFKTGITPQQIKLSLNVINEYQDNLRLSVLNENGYGTGEFVDIVHYFIGDNDNRRVDLIKFTDGTTWNYGDIQARVLIATENSDSLIAFAGADVVDGLGGDDSISGRAGDDILRGSVGNDVLLGQDGNDFLDGGTGNDTLKGGKGDDTYVVDVSTDVITEKASEGTDTVESSVTLTLGNNVENLTLTGANAVNGTGNTLDNVLTGNSAVNTLTGGAGNDRLDGKAGADKMLGGTGNDTYVVDVSTDVITENASEGTDTVESSVTLTLGNNVENLTLTGASAINGTGNTLANVLTGNSANNTLSGGTGADTMIGGVGNDTYVVDNASDTITENSSEGLDNVQASVTTTLAANVENLTLTGTSAINGTGNTLDNVLTGNSAVNTLTGGNGNDRLDGKEGADKMLGGTGNDTYVVDISTDVITEYANEGNDTVESSVTLTLANNVENLTLTGASAIDGTGNALDNVLSGNSANNTLSGGTGADTMIGGMGNDTYVVDNAFDTITENANGGADLVQSSVTATLAANVENLTLTGTTAINGTGNTLDNVLTGNSGNNTLTGNAGNDRLNGGAGNDTMLGGTGNDTYVVDVSTDVITENASEGIDTVESSVTLTLDNNVENLLLTGTSYINGTGNALDNVLTGNAGINILTGAAGNDRLDGQSGADTMVGGAGDDTYVFNVATDIATENANEGIDTVESSVTLTLGNNLENLLLTGTSTNNGTGNGLDNVLTGNSAVNTLTGGAGNDRLDGKAGADKMLGGTGDDTYVVDNSKDAITENANEGTDTVESSITLTLGANVENLVLTGTTTINGTGNALDNVLKGNDAVNSLSGGAGNDTLSGMGGADTLTGGVGNDTYVLGRGYGADTVVENDTTAGNTDLAGFVSGVAIEQIWFQKVGNNLETSIIGTSDKLVVKDWYLGSAYHVEQFKTIDGSKTLLDSNVQNLVNAMASFAPPAAGQTTLPTDYQTALSPVIAANWQ